MRSIWLAGTVIIFLLLSPAAAADGTVAEWYFNETSGDLIDYSGNQFHGTIHDDVVRGIQGVNNSTAYRFDGEDDWVEVPGDPLLDPGESLTVEMWFRPEAVAPSEDSILRVVQRAHSATYGFYVTDTPDIVFPIDTGETSDGGWSAAGDVLPELDQWYHVVGTYNGSEIRLYIDGELADTGEQTGPVDPGGDTSLGIGAKSKPKSFFEGSIDAMRIYDRTLNASEVSWHYRDPPGWDPSPGLDDGSTDNETDDGDQDNETSQDDGTDNETSSGNETDDGGTSNDTTMDNGTVSGNDTSGDDSLFAGGNGTAGSGDTTNDTTMDNGTVSGNGASGTSNQSTNTSVSDGNVTGPGEDTEDRRDGISILPGQLQFTGAPGTDAVQQLQVANDGSRRVSVQVRVARAPTYPEPSRFELGAGETRTVMMKSYISPEKEPGVYTGTVRIMTDTVVRTIPVRVTVTAARDDTSNSNQTTVRSLTVRPGRPEISDGSVRVNGTIALPGPGSTGPSVTVVNRITDADDIVRYRQSAEHPVEGSASIPIEVREQLPAGEYTWTVDVYSSNGSTTEKTHFTVAASEAPEKKGETSALKWIVVAVLVAGIFAALYWRRDWIEEIIKDVYRSSDGTRMVVEDV